MKKCPQRSYLIDPVEILFCIYGYKYPIFCGQLFVPNILNPVNCTIDSSFKTSTTMIILTRTGGFRYGDPQHTVREKVSPSFSYYDCTDARMFIKSN